MMDALELDQVSARTALDARGFATPEGDGREHLWAISGFELPEGNTISVVATCFDSTIWVGRCTAAEVVSRLAEDLGAVLTERELLDFIQEALTGCSNNASGGSSKQQPPQRVSQLSNGAGAAAAGGGGGGGGLEPALTQQRRLTQPHASQQQQQQPATRKPPPLTLHLPVPPGAGADVFRSPGPAGADNGNGAFVQVLLPPSRFDGTEVTVRLPPLGDMVRVSGLEAQTACLTLVANLCQQLDEQRDEMDSLVSELSRTGDENRLLRLQLAAAESGGAAKEGLTLRDQYGLAGAPMQPAGGGAAKRQRSAPATGNLLQLHLQMQLQAAATATVGGSNGGGGEFGPALAAMSQPPLSQPATFPALGAASQAAASNSGRSPSCPLLSRLATTGTAATTALIGAAGVAAAAATAAKAVAPGAGRAASPAVSCLAGEATAAGGFGAVSKVAASGEGLEVVGSSQRQQSTQHEGVVGEGAVSESGLAAGGGTLPAHGEVPAQRDPSRVGVTIKRTGPTGRGGMRGGRGLPRR